MPGHDIVTGSVRSMGSVTEVNAFSIISGPRAPWGSDFARHRYPLYTPLIPSVLGRSLWTMCSAHRQTFRPYAHYLILLSTNHTLSFEPRRTRLLPLCNPLFFKGNVSARSTRNPRVGNERSVKIALGGTTSKTLLCHETAVGIGGHVDPFQKMSDFHP